MEVSMSEMTSSPSTPVNGAGVPLVVTDTQAQHDAAIAAARCAVAEYLRDVGLRDPDLVAQESRRLVSQALERLGSNAEVTETVLAEAAIKLTVKRLEHLLAALTTDANGSEEVESHGRVVGARLTALLTRYSHGLKEKRS